MLCNVQHKPAGFPSFQQRSAFVQDPLVWPKKQNGEIQEYFSVFVLSCFES